MYQSIEGHLFQFANPVYLYALFFIPLLIVVFVIALQLKKRALQRYGHLPLLAQLMPEKSAWRGTLKFIFMLLALSAVIYAIARPQVPEKIEGETRAGVEIMIALDVSNSMLAEDLKPSRLQNAKLAISKLIDRLTNDKIGLIVFAGEAYIQVPLTTDFSAAKMFLKTIDTEIVSVPGTNIGSAIELASRSFDPTNDQQKVLIIITDGEDHEATGIQAAEQAIENNIVIHTIGMGLAEGAPIPVSPGSSQFLKKRDGTTVISKLDETTLKQIAAAGDGVYVRASNAESGLNILYDEINKMEKSEFKARFSDYREHFQYYAGAALLFLLLDFLFLERKNRWLKNVKLFDAKN